MEEGSCCWPRPKQLLEGSCCCCASNAQEVEKKPKQAPKAARGSDAKRGLEAPHPSDDEEVGGALPERRVP